MHAGINDPLKLQREFFGNINRQGLNNLYIKPNKLAVHMVNIFSREMQYPMEFLFFLKLLESGCFKTLLVDRMILPLGCRYDIMLNDK
jgi:hypothetical protein